MSYPEITSLTNARIKKVMQLKDRKERDRTGLTLVEGQREISLALEAGVAVRQVYLCPAYLEQAERERWKKICTQLSAPLFEISEKVYDRMTFGQREAGILAVCQPKRMTLKELSLTAEPLCIIVEGLEKPGNLGAILRTCDAGGVDVLILCQGQTDIYNPNCIRASLGTVFTVPVIETTNPEAHAFLMDRKIPIFGTWPKAKTMYTQMDYGLSSALVLGSEHAGVSAFWRQRANHLIRIPIRGKGDSLNVSAAAAICIYKILEKRYVLR